MVTIIDDCTFQVAMFTCAAVRIMMQHAAPARAAVLHTPLRAPLQLEAAPLQQSGHRVQTTPRQGLTPVSVRAAQVRRHGPCDLLGRRADPCGSHVSARHPSEHHQHAPFETLDLAVDVRQLCGLFPLRYLQLTLAA